MKFTDWLWTNKTTEEIRREAFQPTDESRECGPAAAFSARLEAVRKVDAVLDATCAQLEAHEAQARPTARVFLMPLPMSKMRVAVLGLVLHGYTMKHHGSIVEMVRSYE